VRAEGGRGNLCDWCRRQPGTGWLQSVGLAICDECERDIRGAPIFDVAMVVELRRIRRGLQRLPRRIRRALEGEP
jgi:hypothetical protein